MLKIVFALAITIIGIIYLSSCESENIIQIEDNKNSTIKFIENKIDNIIRKYVTNCTYFPSIVINKDSIEVTVVIYSSDNSTIEIDQIKEEISYFIKDNFKYYNEDKIMVIEVKE